MSITSTPDNPTIGIEFELLFPYGCSGLARELGTRAYGYFDSTADCESDLAVSWDGSVGSSGGEVKFARPIRNSEAMPLIERMIALAGHPEAKFSYAYGTTMEEKLLNHPKVCRHTDTGVHIHYGLPAKWNPINILRLIRLARKHENELKKMAGRSSRRWSKGSQGLVTAMSRHIEDAISCYQRTEQVYRKPIKVGTRYFGLNLTNIGKEDKNTIEFRFLHSAVMTSKESFMEYKNLTDSIFKQAFEDSMECHWGHKYILRYDVYDTIRRCHTLNIFDKRSGDFLAKMYF